MKYCLLINLDCRIDLPHKDACPKVPNLDVENISINQGFTIYVTHRATQHPETQAEDAHVAKVECGLEESIHFGFEEEIVEGVEIDVASGRASRKEGSPLPPRKVFVA